VLLSWIDSFWPRPGDRPCLGLALGRRRLEAARVRWEGGAAQVEWNETVPLDRELFTAPPSLDLANYLAGRLAPVLAKERDRYLILQVALPDPAMRAEVFELAEAPQGAKALREFLAWRLKSGPEPGLEVTGQFMGKAQGKELLLGTAFDGRWIAVIREALRVHGLQASLIDGAFSRRFNFFHDTFAARGGGGALVALERDYWSLVVWDEALRPRLVRAKWWAPGPGEASPAEAAALEVERTIRSYVYSGKGRGVNTLFLNAPGDWMPALSEAFRRRAAGACVALDPGGAGATASRARDIRPFPTAALAVAW